MLDWKAMVWHRTKKVRIVPLWKYYKLFSQATKERPKPNCSSTPAFTPLCQWSSTDFYSCPGVQCAYNSAYLMDVVSQHKGLVSHILVARCCLQKASVAVSWLSCCLHFSTPRWFLFKSTKNCLLSRAPANNLTCLRRQGTESRT